MLDAVLTGRFVTFDDDLGEVDALGVCNGRIVAVGDEAHALPARRRIDLSGSVCFPGFHDAHCHTVSFGRTLVELDLSTPPIASMHELYEAVAARARTLRDGEVLVGRGYDQNKLGAHPDRRALDRAAGDRPVLLQHTSGHLCVVNSAALARIGAAIDAPVDGGHVERDPSGEPTGLLQERAQSLAQALVLPRSVESIAGFIAAAHRRYLEEGVTSVCDAGIAGGWIGESPAELAAYQLARDRGGLAVRTTVMPAADVLAPMERHAEDRSRLGATGGLRTGLGDEWLRIGALKVFADGSLIGRTCWMHEAFEDDPGNVGYPQQDPEALRDLITEAHLAGWQVATHAIGDRAVDLVVDAYATALAAAPRSGHRHRIEHCGVVSEATLRRIAELGIIPVPQGRFVGELGDGMLAALGEERSRSTYRLASFLRAGCVLPGSSDRPVVDGNPLLGIADMAARRTAAGRLFGPDEAIPVEQGLRCYTTGSAYACGREGDLGALSVGSLCDVVALSCDPRTLEPSALDGVRVLATVVGGTLAYEA